MVQTQPILQAGGKDGPEAAGKSKGAGSMDGSRTPTDATGPAPREDVECGGWRPLEPRLHGHS